MGEVSFDRLYQLEFVVYEVKYFRPYAAESGLTHVIFLTDSFPVLEVIDDGSSNSSKTVFNRGKSCLFGKSNGAERFTSDKVQIVISKKSNASSYFNMGTAYLKLTPEFLSVLTSPASSSKYLKVSLDLLNGLLEKVGAVSIHLRLSYLGENVLMRMRRNGSPDIKTVSLQDYNNYRNEIIPISKTASQYIQNNPQTRLNYNENSFFEPNSLTKSHNLQGIPYTILPTTVNYSQTYVMSPRNKIPINGFTRIHTNPNPIDWVNLSSNYHDYDQSKWSSSNYLPGVRTQDNFTSLLSEAASLNYFDPRKQFLEEPREFIFRNSIGAQTSENILFKRSAKFKESNRLYHLRQRQTNKPGWLPLAAEVKRNVQSNNNKK